MSTALAVNRETQEMQDYLRSQAGELAKACTGHITPERLLQVTNLILYKTPKLQKCDRESILASIIQASSLGLDLAPSMGEAWLVPRWNKKSGSNECQFQPGYRGLVKLARQSNEIDYIQARTVHEKDKFTVVYNPDLSLRHEPCFTGDKGVITHVYAVVKLRSGSQLIEVMSWDEIEAVRARSLAKDSGPWVTDWAEMAKKTVLKRLTKSLPSSTEMAIAIEADNRDYEDAEAIEGPKAHHAVNHNNNSGHGSGAYASPDAVKAYQAWLKDAIDQVNAKWLDKHTGRDGEIAEGVKELVTTYQVGGHLYKHGRDHGKFTAPDEPRGVQRDKFTAIWFGRERAAVEKEARRYCWSIWQEKLKQLEPQPEDEPQQHPDDAIDVQPDADDWASHEEAMAREQEEEIARAR